MKMKNFSIAVLCLIVIVLFISFSSYLVRAFDFIPLHSPSLDKGKPAKPELLAKNTVEGDTEYQYGTSQVADEVEDNYPDDRGSAIDGLILYEAEPELEYAKPDFTFTQTGPVVILAEKPLITPALRDIPPLPPEKDGFIEMPLNDMPYGADTSPLPFLEDPVVQTYSGPLVSATILKNFEGIYFGMPSASWGNPPDTNGSAGKNNQYVQWVNTSFAVFDKATGQIVNGGGPFYGNILWYTLDSEHRCRQYNQGDPIAQYDKIANRWVMMQLTSRPDQAGLFYLCIAVSKTDDATGQYYPYAFSTGNVLPDYPKLGVWPDGYYVSFSGGPSGGDASTECALDRSQMLNGEATSMQCFHSTIFGLLPSDLDGANLPPPGSPNYFLAHDWRNSLALQKFHVDWATPVNSYFTIPFLIPVEQFNPVFGNYIPQLDTSNRLVGHGVYTMYRLAYRNFGDYELLVVNHSVDTGATAGIRWYELRNPGTTPYVYQQGTYAPDSDKYRWMGSMAMDRSGNIGLGYSVSSSSMYPAIRFTGREPADPLGTMQTETSIIEGTGSSTYIDTRYNGRWGDYSSLSIDPDDDCTFWYTTEYLQTTGIAWHTRIASFKFPNCGLTSISVNTFPSARQITVDNQAYTAPQNFYWPQSSGHSLNATSPQSGGTGTQYVFSSWSDGGAQGHTITTPSSYTTYTANFNTQYQLTTAVSPSGAGSVSPNCQAGCWYNSGSSVGLNATANSNYVFSSWSGDCSGTSSSTNVTMTAPRSCTANFVPATTITSSPAGRQIIVDSATYTAPQTFYWPVGSSHSLAGSSPQSGGTGTQYIFSSWSDGGAQTHNITVPSAVTTVTSYFTTQYQLTTSFSPAGGGSVTPDCSGTCWQNSGTAALTAVPNSGYIFNSWAGDCSGNSPVISLDMNAPKTCSAGFSACGNQPVINPRSAVSYDSIQDAYDDANTLDGDVLQVLGTTSLESPDLNRAISVVLKGGHNCDFSGNGSYTFLNGSLIISSGTVTIENMILK